MEQAYFSCIRSKIIPYIDHATNKIQVAMAWDKYGPSAGPRRNAQMAEVADALIAFWDGKSRGTKNMIDTANKKDLQVAVVRYDL